MRALPEITVRDAYDRQRTGALLVDVREPHEWAAGHAPEALHLPLSAFDPAALPADRELLFVCHLGGRSAQATAFFVAGGRSALNVQGGMRAWRDAGFAVVDDSGSPGAILD